jgi:hypothetical protein
MLQIILTQHVKQHKLCCRDYVTYFSLIFTAIKNISNKSITQPKDYASLHALVIWTKSLLNDKFQFRLHVPPKSNFVKKESLNNTSFCSNPVSTTGLLENNMGVEWWLDKYSHASSLAPGLLSAICANFRHVYKYANSDNLLCHVCLSVCPSAWNNSAPTGGIFMKSDI